MKVENSTNIEEIKNLPIRAGSSTFRLGDIANVKRGYEAPPEAEFYYNGKPAVGSAISMEKGGNVLELGRDLEREEKNFEKTMQRYNG